LAGTIQIGISLVLVAIVGALWAAPARGSEPNASAILAARPCPPYEAMHQWHRSAEQRAAARQGDFMVKGRPHHLEHPIDWSQDPYGSAPWRKDLHRLSWLGPLLQGHAEDGDLDALDQARRLALDWIRKNPRGGATAHFAWVDKVAADRSSNLAYVARASACAGLLSDAEASEMLASLEAHARYLSSDAYYVDNNHGLFMDAALILMRDYLPTHPRSGAWGSRGWERMRAALRRQVQWTEGVHLEHSPGYHFGMVSFLGRILRFSAPEDAGLTSLLGRMRRAAVWFVNPDGTVPQLGDTAADTAPRWAQEMARAKTGLGRMKRSGYGVVRQPGRYLIVADAFHRTMHKHADELTFDLFEGGRRLVSDTGRTNNDWSSPTDPYPRYVASSPAHSVLTVDDKSFPLSRSLIHGSALTALGAGSGWYVIEGTNPLLSPQGVRHRRTFLYKPGFALVVLDKVRSDRPHTYSRFFQLAPEIEATRAGSARLALSAPGFEGRLTDVASSGPAALRLAQGETNPLRGWYSPGHWRAFIPRVSVELRSRARNLNALATFGLGSAPRAHAGPARDSASTLQVIVTAGRARYRVTAVRERSTFRVSERREAAQP
jgi:hypothetical protein